jgi:hypothetical protein
MTAKEEAEELVNKFAMYLRANLMHDEDADEDARECALIAIEFAADQFEKYCCAEIGLHWTKDDEYTDGSWDHFNYIKQEVEKL